MKKALVSLSIAAVSLLTMQSAWADISNNSCSSGKAKSSGCHGGNEVGGSPSNDASCCAKAIVKLPPFASPGPFHETEKSAVSPNKGDVAAKKHGYVGHVTLLR